MKCILKRKNQKVNIAKHHIYIEKKKIEEEIDYNRLFTHGDNAEKANCNKQVLDRCED